MDCLLVPVSGLLGAKKSICSYKFEDFSLLYFQTLQSVFLLHIGSTANNSQEALGK